MSQIITYGTMAAKAVVRDVGRVLGHPYGFADRIAKLMPFELGMTLDKALAESEDLRQAPTSRETRRSRQLIDMARQLEGLARNAGKHAGGVVIAPGKLTDFSPLYCEPGGDSLVTQFDKDDVEEVGPGQVRLPRSAHPDHHRLGAEDDQRRARRSRAEPPLDISAHPAGRPASPSSCSRRPRPPRCSSSNPAA